MSSGGEFAPPDGSLAIAALGARFDHVAMAAPRIRTLLPIYQDLLGGTFYRGGDNPRVGYRALQLLFPDDRRIELMEPLRGSAFFDRFFARTGGGGFHHVTFLVDDVARAIDATGKAGYTPTSPYLDDPSWREVFLHPKETCGCLIQLVQSDGGPPEKTTLEDVLAGVGPGGTGTPSP